MGGVKSLTEYKIASASENLKIEIKYSDGVITINIEYFWFGCRTAYVQDIRVYDVYKCYRCLFYKDLKLACGYFVCVIYWCGVLMMEDSDLTC